MNERPTRWVIVDRRTDRPVTMSVCLTREQAEEQIAQWLTRDARGKRPDITHILPYLTTRPIRPNDRQAPRQENR